jgi:hypothetical protein
MMDLGRSIVIESLLLAVTRVSTMSGERQERQLTNATGFFFERHGKLFLITSRHVVLDEASHHRPDRLTIELHIDPANVAAITQWRIPLYQDNRPVWREGIDPGGTVDVAALELDRSALPPTLLFRAFTSAHLAPSLEEIEVGTPVRIVGFPRAFTIRCIICRWRGRRSSPRRSACGFRGTVIS